MSEQRWWACRDWYPREQGRPEIQILLWKSRPSTCRWTDDDVHTAWCGWVSLVEHADE